MQSIQCPYCTKEDGSAVEMIAEHLPQGSQKRLDRVLVQVGYWECPSCDLTKPIFQKKPLAENKCIKSIQCFCCDDTGSIYHRLVKQYIFSDYSCSDPPVPCKRCAAGVRMRLDYCWDIGDRALCDRIHFLQIAKVNFSSEENESESTEIKNQVYDLAKKMSI